MKGSYVLLLELSAEQMIPVGSLRSVLFRSGYYAYVGSAMNGIESRLSHHLHKNKKLHWHIDYLLRSASIVGIDIYEAESRVECSIARKLDSQFYSIPGFGCSDCHCGSHLFYSAEKKEMKEAVKMALASLSEPSL
jgi:Uri superfamily endonuclease